MVWWNNISVWTNVHFLEIVWSHRMVWSIHMFFPDADRRKRDLLYVKETYYTRKRDLLTHDNHRIRPKRSHHIFRPKKPTNSRTNLTPHRTYAKITWVVVSWDLTSFSSNYYSLHAPMPRLHVSSRSRAFSGGCLCGQHSFSRELPLWTVARMRREVLVGATTFFLTVPTLTRISAAFLYAHHISRTRWPARITRFS